MNALNDLIGLGHNQPPSVSDEARERVAALVAAANQWATVTIADEHQAARLKDHIDQLRAEWKKCDDARKAEKKPHDEAAAAVQAAWGPILGALTRCAESVKAIETDWLRREQARLERERREREAAAEQARQDAMAAARAAQEAAKDPAEQVAAEMRAEAASRAAQDAEKAAAAVPERAQSRGSYGAAPARSLRTVWKADFEGDDPNAAVLKAARHYRGSPELRECLLTLANRDARALRERAKIPGMRVFPVKE